MPVGLRLNFPNNGRAREAPCTPETHDKVTEVLNFPFDWPDGLITHAAYEVDGQLVLSEVWESRRHFDRFAEERLRPAIAEAMGDRANEPEISLERELHHFSSKEHTSR